MDISDQLPIFVFVESNITNVKKGPIVRTKMHFNEYVFNDISQKLENTDWSYLINCNVDEAYMQFSNKLNDIIDSATSEKTIKVYASQVRRNPWMTTGLVKSSRTLNSVYKLQLGKDKWHINTLKYIKYINIYNKLKIIIMMTFSNYIDTMLRKRGEL